MTITWYEGSRYDTAVDTLELRISELLESIDLFSNCSWTFGIPPRTRLEGQIEERNVLGFSSLIHIREYKYKYLLYHWSLYTMSDFKKKSGYVLQWYYIAVTLISFFGLV
jgi:hypothetical protein